MPNKHSWKLSKSDKARLISEIKDSGKSIAQIAKEFGMSPATVHGYSSRLQVTWKRAAREYNRVDWKVLEYPNV